MNKHLYALVGAIILTGSLADESHAAPCRVAEAAIRGSQAGYERDTQAAIETAEKDKSSSDILGKCIGGVTAVITSPTFPSLDDMFDNVFDKICRVASQQVHGKLSDVNSQIGGLSSGVRVQRSSSGLDVQEREREVSGNSWMRLFGGY